MKKHMYLLLSVLLSTPVLTTVFAPGDAGMAVCLLHFFAFAPLCSILWGWGCAEISCKWRRLLPCAAPLCFLFGVWIVFPMSEHAFLLYAAGYLALSMLSSFLAQKVHRK